MKRGERMLWIGIIIGVILSIIIWVIILHIIHKAGLIIDFSLYSDQPFSLEIYSSLDDISKRKWVLLDVKRK